MLGRNTLTPLSQKKIGKEVTLRAKSEENQRTYHIQHYNDD
jgi:hypothetical protein